MCNIMRYDNDGKGREREEEVEEDERKEVGLSVVVTCKWKRAV